MNVPAILVTAIVGGCLAIIGSLIILNLRSIKACVRNFTTRVEKTEDDMKTLGTDFHKCKVDCERSFVNTELFLRETGFTRRCMETMNQSVNRMEGKLTVVEKLPKICGDISREIVKEMKNGENNG